MPVVSCTKDGKRGHKWGSRGFCYIGRGSRAKAERQGRAIEARKRVLTLELAVSNESSDSKLANRMTSEIIRQENRAIRGLLDKVRSVRVGARQAIKTGRNVISKGFNLEKLQKDLRDLLVVQHIQGAKRATHCKRCRKSLQLSDDIWQLAAPRVSIADLLKEFRKTFNVGLLRELYERDAIQVLIDLQREVNEDLIRFIDELIAKELPVSKALKELERKLDHIGITANSPFKLETLFRTQSQLAYNAGKFQEEQDPDIQSILWGYKYVTVGDDRVRDSHKVLDGVTLPKENDFWRQFYPPNGWNCRCVAIPIFNPRKEKHPPEGAEPDAGFGFNPGELRQDVSQLINQDNP